MTLSSKEQKDTLSLFPKTLDFFLSKIILVFMKLLHTMIRVRDLQKSIDFYTKVLGMKLMRKRESPDGKYTLAFLEFEEEKSGSQLELTYNWETNDYEMGNAFGHIAIQVEDVYLACDKIKSLGGKVVRQAGPVKGGTSILAFVEDPDGYKIELLA